METKLVLLDALHVVSYLNAELRRLPIVCPIALSFFSVLFSELHVYLVMIIPAQHIVGFFVIQFQILHSNDLISFTFIIAFKLSSCDHDVWQALFFFMMPQSSIPRRTTARG